MGCVDARGARSSRPASRGGCPASWRSTRTAQSGAGHTSCPRARPCTWAASSRTRAKPPTPCSTRASIPRCGRRALQRVSCFLPRRAEGFEAALRERGFACEHYHYLSRPIAPGEECRRGRAVERAATCSLPRDLLRESYGPEGRHFAPRGTPDEWEQYVRSLVERPGCGVIEPAVTRVVRNGTTLQALVLATRIAPGTLHLPQVAVHPSRRREGLAHRLVEEACRAAAARGVKAGHAARRREQHQRQSALREDGIRRDVGVHCGDEDGLRLSGFRSSVHSPLSPSLVLSLCSGGSSDPPSSHGQVRGACPPHRLPAPPAGNRSALVLCRCRRE